MTAEVSQFTLPISGPISVHVSAGRGWVWNAESAETLRLQHGIVGAMAGTLPEFRQQNIVKGLPMELMPEEISYALEQNWITLHESLGSNELSPEEGPSTVMQARSLEEPGALGRVNKESGQLESDMSKSRHSGAAVSTLLPIERPASGEAPLGSGSTDGQDFSGSITKPSTSPGYIGSLQNTQGRVELPLVDRTAGPPGDWTYPHSALERCRCLVFADLHRRGYRVTNGTKFGADFLAYPGDPSLFHSHFAVRVVEPHSPLPVLTLVTSARVALAARKKLVVATLVPAPPLVALHREDAAANAAAPRRHQASSSPSDVDEGLDLTPALVAPDNGARSSVTDPIREHQLVDDDGHAYQQQLQAGEAGEGHLSAREVVAYSTLGTDLEFMPHNARTQKTPKPARGVSRRLRAPPAPAPATAAATAAAPATTAAADAAAANAPAGAAAAAASPS